MKFNECKTAKEFYHWCMYRDGMKNWTPWDNLPQSSKQWWKDHWERTKRSYYEKGIEREEPQRYPLY